MSLKIFQLQMNSTYVIDMERVVSGAGLQFSGGGGADAEER